VAFRIQSIGRDFDAARAGFFEPGYMRALFAHGEARGRDPASWLPAPPPVGLINASSAVPAPAGTQGTTMP
jgi:hypothetical protein